MKSNTTFKQLGIIEPILKVCNEEKFEYPTEIQEKSIPYVLDGRDVIGEASTGSGKTLAFASGIIQNINQGSGIKALIITPTRELASQVTDMVKELSKYKKLRIISIYGGVSINPQIRDLKKADIVVGTPGRLIDHIQRGTMDLRGIKILVLDECDRLLDMGFLPDIEKIILNLPKERQTLLFSATVSSDVNKIAQKYMSNPIEIGARSYVDPNKLTQIYYGPLDDSLKFSLLVHLLKQEKQDGLSLIFCNTRKRADMVAKNLSNSNIKTTVLHGGYSQPERSKRLNNFQSEKIKILVATDVAARGLDIEGVTNIYNYDLPSNLNQYIHRIGRTARAGKTGQAITLVSQRDGELFFNLFRYNKTNIQKEKTPFVKKLKFEKTSYLPSKTHPQTKQFRRNSSNIPFSRYSI